MSIEYQLVGPVVITKSRWNVIIVGRGLDGKIVELVASADRAYTDNDGIYLDTREDFESHWKNGGA